MLEEEFDESIKKWLNNSDKKTDYFRKIDLHALNPNSNLKSVVTIASEHGFRGIMVHPCKAEELVKVIKEYGSNSLIPITVLDYPFGSMSLDIRNYALGSAKERGIKEIEIVAPYPLIAQKEFGKVGRDLEILSAKARELRIGIKYVLDYNCPFVDDTVRSKMCQLLKDYKVPMLSTSLGFYDSKTSDHADSVIYMRDMKRKSGCDTKVYIASQKVDDILSYSKAGVDVIGLPWNKAAYLIHEYEELIEKKG